MTAAHLCAVPWLEASHRSSVRVPHPHQERGTLN
jgi:hypothetical protein